MFIYCLMGGGKLTKISGIQIIYIDDAVAAEA